MRLIFSTTDYLNTDISDEHGLVHYKISTPFALHQVTTITKYHWNGQNRVPETMGTIQWHLLRKDEIQFHGHLTPADVMLEKHNLKSDCTASGRYFVGPDHHTYKWKIDSSHCWMKTEESDLELARFHEKNLGIMKAAHPAYLEISPNVASMLDHIIITFIYAEKLRQDRKSLADSLADAGN